MEAEWFFSLKSRVKCNFNLKILNFIFWRLSFWNSDNSFSRGPLDYRNLLLDAKSASLYVGARGRLFRLWVYNINDTTENLVGFHFYRWNWWIWFEYTERIIPVSESDLSDCVSEGSSDEECQFSSRFMAFQDKKQSIYVSLRRF